MPKKQTENLPAVFTEKWVMPVDETPVPAELLETMEESDNEGFEVPVSSLPYVRIRGRDLKGDDGQTIMPTGGFAMDLKGTPDIPDVDGETGLTLTVCFDQNTRIFWKDKGDKQPTCRSNDRTKGDGEPADDAGGYCLNCPLSKWDKKDKPKCRSEVKLFCLDHNTPDTFYILTLGPSGLAPYDNLKKAVGRQRVSIGGKQVAYPLHYKRIHLTTQYKAEPQGHYIPALSIVGDVSPEDVKIIKSLRSKFMGMLSAHVPDAEADTSLPGKDQGGELPPGATRVETVGSESSGDGAPPC